MSETIPVLSVGRQVTNIGPEQIEGLRGRLLEGEEDPDASRETVEGLLIPGRPLYSWIIAQGEFLRIQRNLGEDRLDEGEVRSLEELITQAMAAYPGEREADTLPAKPKHIGPRPKRALTIANGMENIGERHAAQGIISHFLGYRFLPKGWFSRARKVVPVELAASGTEEELRLLQRLAVVINEDQPQAREGEELPAKTVLGAVETSADSVYIRD